jgi:hypothetical protein
MSFMGQLLNSESLETLTGNGGSRIDPAAGNFDLVGANSWAVTGNPATHTLTITGNNVLPFILQSSGTLHLTPNEAVIFRGSDSDSISIEGEYPTASYYIVRAGGGLAGQPIVFFSFASTIYYLGQTGNRIRLVDNYSSVTVLCLFQGNIHNGSQFIIIQANGNVTVT